MTMKIESQDGKPIKITPELKGMLLERLQERRNVLEAERKKELDDVKYRPILLRLRALNREHYASVRKMKTEFKRLAKTVVRMSGSRDQLGYNSEPDCNWPANYKPNVVMGDRVIFDANKKYREIAVKLQYEKSVDIDAILKQIDSLK